MAGPVRSRSVSPAPTNDEANLQGTGKVRKLAGRIDATAPQQTNVQVTSERRLDNTVTPSVTPAPIPNQPKTTPQADTSITGSTGSTLQTPVKPVVPKPSLTPPRSQSSCCGSTITTLAKFTLATGAVMAGSAVLNATVEYITGARLY